MALESAPAKHTFGQCNHIGQKPGSDPCPVGRARIQGPIRISERACDSVCDSDQGALCIGYGISAGDANIKLDSNMQFSSEKEGECNIQEHCNT